MKNKLAVIGILLAMVSVSCNTQTYLPDHEELDVSYFGSFIKIRNTTGSIITGELIAVDSNGVIVLTNTDGSRQAVTVQKEEIEKYKVIYAKAKNYAWTIPLYAALTASHGMWLTPVNLLVTTAITASAITQFQYNRREMAYGNLYMFARFPQGLPPNIDILSLK